MATTTSTDAATQRNIAGAEYLAARATIALEDSTTTTAPTTPAQAIAAMRELTGRTIEAAARR